MVDEIVVQVVEKEAISVNLVEGQAIKVEVLSVSGGIASNPPDAHYRVTNLWVNKNTGKLHIEYETP